jgi:hypothetical protein
MPLIWGNRQQLGLRQIGATGKSRIKGMRILPVGQIAASVAFKLENFSAEVVKESDFIDPSAPFVTMSSV